MIHDEHIEKLRNYEIPTPQLLQFFQEIQLGSPIKQAYVLADILPKQGRHLESIYSKYLDDELDESSTDYIVAYYISKAMAVRDKRWLQFVESGGKVASAGMWLLERRVGGEFSAPVQKVQQEIKAGVIHSSVSEAIEATKNKLQISKIEEQGDYWAMLQTAVQKQRELPELPKEDTNE